MKGLGTSHSRHLSDSCDPSSGHVEALYPQKTSTMPRSPYLLSPTMDHYGTMDPHLYPSANPGSLPAECLLPLNNQLSNSSTFPRIHYNSYDPSDFSPPAESIGGIGTGTLGASMSMGMGAGMGMAELSGRSLITSGSATISHHMTKHQTPASLLQFDKQLPGGRDGFSTLQFHRTSALAAAKQRTDSPGRIRYMLHSVQKLFAKSQSLESHNMKGNINGRSTGSGGGSSSTDDGGKHTRRSKSKDRGTKAEATAKRRPRSNMSGYWSSDDLDSSDISSFHNTMAMMTMGRPTGHESQTRYIPSGYNTISSSKSSSDMKYQTPGSGGGNGLGGIGHMVMNDNDFMKGGSWSALTMGQPRQVIQKGSATLDRSLLKSRSCQQELTCNYLQVGRRGDWSSSLGRSGGANEIPCRRMRSGSYVKAMADMEDSDDSEGSPKPSPKTAARRQSYLRATQHSLSDQLPPRNCLPSLRELANNRSVDNLDCIGGTGSPVPHWDDDDFSHACSTLGRRSCVGQLRDLDMSHPYEDRSSDSTYRDSRSHSQDNPEPPDLPMPTCFRSRSHSYLRAIQAGCSQDDDVASIDSGSLPPTDTTVRTYSTSTDGLSTQWKTWKEQFGSYLIANGLDKAPKEKQLAIFLQRLGTDRPRIIPTHTVSCITTCKKAAPPPVPPRTTSKPYISVTVQSSTESAQDNYLEQRSEVNSQSSHAHSNSSDSLDSTRANSLARGIPRPPHIIPTPIATPREPLAPTTANASTETSNSIVQHESMKSGLSNSDTDEALVVPVPRRKLSSIGIQVDCIQEVPREETPPLAKFQSIGVQVEDGWQPTHPSSMASKQDTDSYTQDIPVKPNVSQAKPTEKKVMVSSASQSLSSPPGQDSLDNGDTTGEASSPPPPRQILNRSTTRSSSSSFSESLDPALDPSSLPPPEPWLESGNGSSSSTPQSVSGGGTLCRRDGHWFLKLLQAETGRMEGWCQQMDQETKDNQLSEEVLGKVRSAVGSAQLLISQKFQQFRGLCEQNLNVNANPRPTPQDLAGFWDLLQLSIEDISLKFDELYHLKSNDWHPVLSVAAQSPPERKDEEKAPKKAGKGRPSLCREKSTESSSTSSSVSAEKQRQEARKRLLAAKKAASFRQNSATESADSIEIYVPEAQTRL
ncbi:disks large-associated protein 4 isoform X2 [Dunckerocampus dactyliophorus]|uniref:disks large-associated protein 4 isoform X2 n=1 Tax=Dunckerocampus dactyliophorus TaxID=161453 RepID=UPI002405AAA1|nr:disks large-associated protein 4 isoform X2 [Dunckerocampus dactyliophorus]